MIDACFWTKRLPRLRSARAQMLRLAGTRDEALEKLIDIDPAPFLLGKVRD